MSVVYATHSAFIGHVRIKKGDAWDSESDVVKASPSMFSDEPTQVRGVPRPATVPAKASKKAASRKAEPEPEPDESDEDEEEEETPQRIERATRAPGERRGPRGPRTGGSR